MPATLDEYRWWTMQDEGGALGIKDATVDMDPEVLDRDAARSIISAKLFDSEYLSGAYGGTYVWVPRWSDSRRIEDRGYRVRFASIFEPPTSGSFRLQVFGYGETEAMPWQTSSSTIEDALNAIDPDLADLEVEAHPSGHIIHLPFRAGLGSTAGRFVGQGGVGICLVNRDFSRPLAQGDRVLLSPRIPFGDEDNIQGVHTCINMALADITIPDLLPVVSDLPRSSRGSVLPLSSVAPWLEEDAIIGFYSPTDWLSISTFVPPTTGTYTFLVETATVRGPSAPLAYNATGAQIEAALNAIWSPFRFAVEPSAAAPSYRIGLRTMHHQARVTPSAGNITAYKSERLRDPFPISLTPHYQGDYEANTLSDPGYAEDQTWFVAARRRAHQRICPQTYPRNAKGALDTTKAPIKGTEWIESVTGLVNDLDQALPEPQKVVPAALRYCFLSLAAASPLGEEEQWLEMARKSAGQSAAKLIYGVQERRPGRRTAVAWPQGEKSLPFFLSG